MKQYSIILIALMAISCGAEEQKALQDTSSLDTAVKTIHPEIFNRTFKTALNAYYNLKDYYGTLTVNYQEILRSACFSKGEGQQRQCSRRR